ncbi:hypothetical protein [Nocardia sp. NPDC004860]|uniref:hypothetical protein n=1 Tax=Nocardia sp. NPDC004860 TaxID=3154557 RepID=UPI0033B7C53A
MSCFRVLASQYPDGCWRVFHSATKVVADFVDRDDIKLTMAKWICRKTGDQLDYANVLIDVVSAAEIMAAEAAVLCDVSGASGAASL